MAKFGLALNESSSFYVLDPQKVGRLSWSYLSEPLTYERIRELLKLQDYGFNIRIIPLFNVTVTLDDTRPQNDLLFNVNVTDDGRPIPNADVEAIILYVLQTGNPNQNYFNFTSAPRNSTNELGECTIGYTLPSDADYILILKVSVADMSTVTVPYYHGFSQKVANASINGDTVTLWIPHDAKHAPERVIHNITAVTPDGVWNYPGVGCGIVPRDHLNPGDGNFQYWIQNLTGLSYEGPLFLIFNLWTQEESGGPKHWVLFATSPLLNIRSGLLQLGPPSAQTISTAAIKLCRTVEIAGMTYIFEFLLWKET